MAAGEAPVFADGRCAMMARWLCTTMVSALLFSSGCCCFRNPCDPCGPPTCCFTFPCLQCLHPIAWDGCCNDCGPSPCESCGDYCGGCRDGLLSHCFLFGGLRGCWSCGRGCSEIYCDEWKSDPPDCCDPCDQCYGCYTGPHGCCGLGPFQRILACLDGYRYCPPPNCGPWRPIFGHCNPGPGPCCGDPGCSGCGGGPPHGADVYYDGPPGPVTGVPTTSRSTAPQRSVSPPQQTAPAPRTSSRPIFEEQLEEMPPPRSARPLPGPQQPPHFQMGQMSGRNPQRTSERTSERVAAQRMSPEQVAAAKRAAQKRAEMAAGVRGAAYQR